MDEQKIREIAQSVYDQNSSRDRFTAQTNVTLHKHNGNDAPKIPIQNIAGVTILPVTNNVSTTILNARQLIEPNNGQNGGVFSVPLPVVENATGDPFVLGEAPEGTLLLGTDLTGEPIGVYLFARVEGAWHYVALTAV